MDDPPIPPHRAAEASIAEASIVLELDRPAARPGDRIRLRVLVPQVAERLDAIYGLGATLEQKNADGCWVPTHFLRFGIDGAPDFVRYGDPGWGMCRAVGLSGPAWRALRIPDDAVPGEYRIVKRVGGRAFDVPLVIRQVQRRPPADAT
jgi:hypothetical protein